MKDLEKENNLNSQIFFLFIIIHNIYFYFFNILIYINFYIDDFPI